MRPVDSITYRPPITNDTLKVGNAVRQLRSLIALIDSDTGHLFLSDVKRHLFNLLSDLEEK